MRLSIIILSYNTKDLTLRCINSVIKQYGEQIKKNELEIIVVDNNSNDESVQEIKRFNKMIKNKQACSLVLLENKENYGFSKGNNIGAKKASGEYMLFLNSDTKVEDQGLLRMVDFLNHNQKAGILGGKLLNIEKTQQGSCGSFYNLFNLAVVLAGGERVGFIRKKPLKTVKVDWVSGASMMVRSDLFKKLKGFEEKLFMYMEDMELCFRAKKFGFQTYFFFDIKIVHQELGSSNRSFAVNQIYKGLLYFYKNHKPHWQFILVKLMLFVKASLALLIGVLSNNLYLKKTYGQALKVSI